MTFRIGRVGDREHRRVLKKYDIGRDKVLMCIRRVAVITLLSQLEGAIGDELVGGPVSVLGRRV